MKKVIVAILLAMGVVAFTVGVAAAVSVPEVDNAVASFTADSPIGATPTPCLNGAVPYVSTTGVASGPSVESPTGGLFDLNGTATINTAQLLSLGTLQGVAHGSFLLTNPATPKLRLKGTFNAVVQGLGTALNPYPVHGRGFLSAAQQKKTSLGWKPTGAVLFGNVEFTTQPISATVLRTVGHIGDATDGYPDFAAKFVGGCP
jgi:hypothetical protein